VQKYTTQFDCRCFSKATKFLEKESSEKSPATFFNWEKSSYNYTGYLFIHPILILLFRNRALLLYKKRNFQHVLRHRLLHRFPIIIDSSRQIKLYSEREMLSEVRYSIWKRKPDQSSIKRYYSKYHAACLWDIQPKICFRVGKPNLND
jgi:hypothetical protein